MLRFYINCHMSNFKILLGSEWKFDVSAKCMPIFKMNKTGLEASGDQAFLKVFWHFCVLSLEVPFTQPFPQHFGTTRLDFV